MRPPTPSPSPAPRPALAPTPAPSKPELDAAAGLATGAIPRRADEPGSDTADAPIAPTAGTAARRSAAAGRLFLRRLAIVVGLCLTVGVLQGLATGEHWDQKFVYAFAIGGSIWALVEGGRFLFRRDPETGWPTGWRALVLDVGSFAIGYVVGTSLGDAYAGRSTWELLQVAPRLFLLYLLASTLIAVVFWYVFYVQIEGQRRAARLAAAERDATALQLKLLASQLEPHMLFNTLANLRVLIALDPPRAQAMLDRLIDFLRASLSASLHATQTLADEFARLDDYLALMQVRMGARLAYHLDLPDALAAHPLPPLLLQPLVENAIRHGLEPLPAGGRLSVTARRQADRLVLTVQDDGVGLVDGATPTPGGTHFGLQQVRQRLATLHGDAAAFLLEAVEDPTGGVRATVRLPWVAMPGLPRGSAPDADGSSPDAPHDPTPPPRGPTP